MDASRPFVGFNNQDEVDIILPVKTAFVRYQINPVENTIKEQLIGSLASYVFLHPTVSLKIQAQLF